VPLDPQMQRQMTKLQELGLPRYAELTPLRARRALRELHDHLRVTAPPADVRNVVIEGPGRPLHVRLYAPPGAKSPPLVVFLHGGGWVLGTVAEYDALCRQLAAGARCAVACVDYRLAPEHRFPAALEDCYRAAAWLSVRARVHGIDGARMGVLGESAGGNLAAALTLLARDRAGPQIACQCLVCPVTDLAMDSASYKLFGTGYGLTARDLMWFRGHYLSSHEQIRDPLVSPLRARSLEGLPAALVMTAEFDPLRDEGEAYARRLAAQNVPAELVRVRGVIHGFLDHADSVDLAREALAGVSTYLSALLARQGPEVPVPGNTAGFPGHAGEGLCDHDAH
jgi:acetyl esterase